MNNNENWLLFMCLYEQSLSLVSFERVVIVQPWKVTQLVVRVAGEPDAGRQRATEDN